MKIGVDANLLLRDQHTGIEVYLAALLARMPRLCRHQLVLCFNCVRARHQKTVARFACHGVTVRVCRIPGRIMGRLHWRHGLPVDWVYGRMDVMFYPACVSLPQRHGRKVVTVHDLFPITHPAMYRPEEVREFEAGVRPSVEGADAILVISTYTEQVVQEQFGIRPDRIHCTPMGVDERFRPPEDPEMVDGVAARYGIRGPYFLFVGTFEPRKNLVRLVDAFGRAARGAVREHALVLAGKPGRDEAAVRSAIARLEPGLRVLLPGYVAADDLPALYAGATAFLFPSLVEGFGIPALEAMASGCPVLASAAPALDEVVGDAALLVDPWDSDAIAVGIRRLAEESALRETLRIRGLRRAKEFSWDRTAAVTLAVLEAV